MSLPASGNTISLDQIHVELGEDSGTTVALGDTDVRALASDNSGAIGMNQFFGLSNVTPRGLLMGGFTGNGETATIEHMTITSSGSTGDFGDLSEVKHSGQPMGMSNTRSIFAGGLRGGAATGTSDRIEFVTVASTGDVTDFGDLAVNKCRGNGVSSQTRGIQGKGFDGSGDGSASNAMAFVTIASAGASTDFGDLTDAKRNPTAANSPTIGLFAGGYNNTNVIDQIVMASAGNSTDFGDLTGKKNNAGAGVICSNTRGIIECGGQEDDIGGFSNEIAFVTFASAGNAADFGDLTVVTDSAAKICSREIGISAGGAGDSLKNVIQKFNIASAGNAIDYGDLVTPSGGAGRQLSVGTSNVHGGLT